MHAFYINLESQTDRREFLERNFRDCCPEGWALHRIDAVDTRAVREQGIPGRLRDNEKACFMSHVKAIEQSLAHEGHALILEDDAMFGPGSLRVIESALRSKGSADWDLLYTDIAVPDPRDMVKLYMQRRDLMQQSRIFQVELDKFGYAGATAYIVNAASRKKLLALLQAEGSLDVPYDLLLRKWVQNGALKGHAIFPFATTLSQHADRSQIQPEGGEIADLAWNAFRRLTWFDADERSSGTVHALDAISPDLYDQPTLDFAKILAVVLSANFKAK